MYDGTMPESVLQEIIKENVQKTIHHDKNHNGGGSGSIITVNKARTRNNGISQQNSNTIFGTGNSIDRKTTQGGSTNNNSVTVNNNSSTKKRKSAPFYSSNQSRNQTHIKNS